MSRSILPRPAAHLPGRRRARRAGQRGVVLIVALVVLVVMALAGLLMFRATGTGVEVAGNIGFKQNATGVGDLGVETGRVALLSLASNVNLLDVDHADIGYYASWNTAFNPLTYDWTGASKEAVADDGTGNRVRYVVHRLCEITGPPTAAGQHCSMRNQGGGSAGGISSASFSGIGGQPYYRITSRVDGPRSTVSYVQVIMF